MSIAATQGPAVISIAEWVYDLTRWVCLLQAMSVVVSGFDCAVSVAQAQNFQSGAKREPKQGTSNDDRRYEVRLTIQGPFGHSCEKVYPDCSRKSPRGC